MARVTENERLFEDAEASMKDPTKLVITNITKKCWSCGEPIGELGLRPDTLHTFVASPETVIACPHCGANLLKDLKVDEIDFNETTRWLMKKTRPAIGFDLPQTDESANLNSRPDRKRRI